MLGVFDGGPRRPQGGPEIQRDMLRDLDLWFPGQHPARRWAQGTGGA